MYGGLAQFVTKNLNLKRMAIMGFNEEFGQANTEAFRKGIERIGVGKIVGVEWYQLDERNFSSLITKLMKANPDAIVLTGAVADCALIVKQARAVGFKGVFLGNGPQSLIPFRKIAGEAAEGTYLATPYAPGFYKHVEAKAFAAEWAAKFKGQKPAWTAAHAYDAFNILVGAMRKAGMDKANVIEAIRQTKNFPGVAGITSFMASGEMVKPVFIQQWKGMQVVPIASLNVKVK